MSIGVAPADESTKQTGLILLVKEVTEFDYSLKEVNEATHQPIMNASKRFPK